MKSEYRIPRTEEVFGADLTRVTSTKTINPTPLKGPAWIEGATILPHPNPRPPGAGTTIVCRYFFNTAPASSDSTDSQHRTAILPLPAGEGRGEGERLESFSEVLMARIISVSFLLFIAVPSAARTRRIR